ncbi:HepT-like ribonuclease domain-containing protein [Magnetospirillum gryphiswaldense]|nr:DUF86 domain-containing protein [Magnetospirillum gryphiswaldense]AVM72949.1 hypothetical protein MSR1_04370 [Magnetospirillum gryphiswaldense MSR-1]AVM76852.1 hypothetical protein MSR1L_04370 [Magnetospirillum gryphiswaldense]CAM78129.1 conserved hypothetical protein [Magnetospirillum gryphiswaldense MSR-1]
MTQKDWRVRVEDMLEAIDRIESYVDGMNTAQFVADSRTQDAVIRNLEILGEASKRIPFDIIQRHPELPWSRIGDMRNILVHEYHSVDPEIILDAARNDLPPLVAPLKTLLADKG